MNAIIRIFFRRGCISLLLYFNTNKPHSFFFFGRIPVVLENRRSSQGGGHPLHPPLDPPLIIKTLYHFDLLFLQLTVTVLDVNDFTPAFEPPFYVRSVVEDTRALGDAEDKVLLTVSAKDEDQGDNAKVIYTIIKGNEEGKVDLVFSLEH